ncbi:MAG: peptidylprolyl isomerase [Methylococcales bacterium]|nr:peptidylprolyl isomerase [Methylococcales bacterium]
MRKIIIISFIWGLSCFSLKAQAEPLDHIIAIVEEDVVLNRELNQEVAVIAKKIIANQMPMPPEAVLRKQVLERLILQKLQYQLAKRSGAQVSDEMLQSAIANIARENKMNLQQFKETFKSQGLNYQHFAKKVKSEIILEQLRLREISNRIKVTDREVQHYLETRSGIDENVSYHLGHILIALPEGANATKIQTARLKADKIIAKLRQGKDFKQLALRVSEGNRALTGGDLGWRSIDQMPTIFTDIVPTLKKGDIAEAVRSPSGFHIIKLLDLKGNIDLDQSHSVTKTNVRHILIKTNELINDEDAQQKLQGLKQRIKDGDKFAVLARSHSDDTASSLKGGGLGWVTSGVLVPAFEQAMNRLGLGEISEPIQSPFGWHLIQVLERDEQDDSSEFGKNQVREQIRRRKIEEETELWMRRLRSEAFVEIYLERL